VSDHDELPKSNSEFVLKFVWGTVVFALGFEGITKLVEGELRTAGWCLGAAVLLSLALVNRLKIAAFTRSNMVAILITVAIGSALALGFAIGGLFGRNGPLSPNQISAGRITWNFDQPGDVFVLNMGETNDQGIRVIGFQAHGKNNSPDPVSEFSGVMRSDYTNAERPIYILAQDPNAANKPQTGPWFMYPTLPNDTFGIPGLADFDIATHNSIISDYLKDGEPLADFIRNFGAFTVVLKYDGTTIERHYTVDQIKAQVELFEKRIKPQSTSIPRVTRKPTAPPAPTLPFMVPALPPSEQQPPAKEQP
jgi:hypothetical protein